MMKETVVQVDNIEDQRDETLLPRIGVEYQAEIPSSILKFDHNCSTKSPDDTTETDTDTHSNVTWTKVEEESLMLGLYIFGKSFAQVTRLIGSKTIDDVQFFYYTKFYNSDNGKRWHAYKKAIKDDCKEKLFTEPTHQHILRRLLNNESEECCSKIFEVCKSFWGGKLSVENYAIALKDLVGIEALIDAVGIGKVNDVTNLAENSIKSVYVILEEKDFSKIASYIEIMHILSGDFRISKTQASDLFWQAVWPRLLAKGWHSEQPSSTLSNKSAIIFIVPGIGEYSRKLVKGIHYFDSIKDLLDLVASYPLLIKDPASENDSDNMDPNGSTSGVTINFEENPSIEVSPEETTIDVNLVVTLENVEGDESMVNEVPAEINFDEPNVVTLPTSEDRVGNQAVETPRKSRRLPKPTTKALEAVVDKYEEKRSNKRMRR